MYTINLGSLWNWNLWLRSDKHHLLNIGKIYQSIGLGGIESIAIKSAKRSHYNNKVDGLAETNPKKWWHEIKSLIGQDTFGKREWYHQFLSDVITSPAELATQIYVFFTSITHEFEPLMPAQTPPNVVPSDLLVSLEEVSSFFHKLSTHKVVGPDRTNC